MRWYTTGVAVVTGGAVAFAIDMNGQAADSAKAHRAMVATRKATLELQAHSTDVAKATSQVLLHYQQVYADGMKTRTRLLADLRKARTAARKSSKVNIAPVVVSIQSSWSGPSVASAPSSGASTSTS